MHGIRTVALLIAVWLSCAVISESAECYRNFDKGEFPSCTLLSPTYALHWKLDAENVTFAIDADEVSDGYVSLGVSEAGSMKAADIWVVTKSSSGNWTVWDMHSVALAKPIMDTKQDVTLVSVPKATSTSVAAVLTRKLRGCDVSDLDIHPNISTPFIWAHGPIWKYHGGVNRGSELLVLTGAVPAPIPADTKTLEFLMPNVEIPTNRTTYWCTSFEIVHDRKYHAVEAKFKIDSPLVHHMILFACDSAPFPVGTVYPCDSMPRQCGSLVFVWAPGLANWHPPADAAIPIGKGYTQYVALQMHYTNPGGIQGRKDSSGISVGYTPELRKYDIGMLILGQSNLTIPAGQSNYSTQIGLCPAECTDKFTEPLNILGVAFHQHEVGLTIKTQHFRDGAELPLIGVRNRWDFNFQNMLPPFPDANVIMPGDTLVTTCSYNTTSRSSITKFGEETMDEMCFSFIQYYPRQEQEVCMSRVDRGISTCASIDDLNALVKNFTKPDNSTVKPASNEQASGGAKPAASVKPANTSTDESTQIDYEGFMAAALSQGYLVLFDPAKYNLSEFTPYTPEDKCPAFLSAEDYGPPQANSTPNTTKNSAAKTIAGFTTIVAAMFTISLWLGA